jgi:hypothetical protein
MKPSKRCSCCNKPIWDSGFLSIRNHWMDCDDHIHSQCYETARAEELNAENRTSMETKMLDLDRWLLEEEAESMNAAFDRKEREIDMAYEEVSYNEFILELGEDA